MEATKISLDILILVEILMANNPPNDQPSSIGLSGKFLIISSRPYIYTTAIAPAICVATLKSLDLIKQGEQKAKLLANIDFFRNFSQAIGLPISPSNSAIQPLIIGDSEKALKISQKLFDQGFYVSAIRAPTVPKGTERLRITLSANHTQNQIEQLLVQIKNALQ